MAQIVLSDENCVGHSRAIVNALERIDMLKLTDVELRTFDEVGLPEGADDETVWRFCQENGHLLLTGNRTMKDGAVSLEVVIRHLV